MATEYPGGRTGPGELPSAGAVLRAFRAPADSAPCGHCVLDSARELVQCHERRRAAQQAARAPGTSARHVAAYSQLVDDIDSDRAKLVEHIDNWVADNIAHRAGASLHTETLGAVIDRMAGKWVAAQDALGLPLPSTKVDARARATVLTHRAVDGEAHLHWVRLAELADGYKDLVTDVVEHRRRLPVF
ncbi:DUF4254 domain-containing protein [Nocardia terpenica]|uniref:DUF4254 domain-containing protein n=1 Tax=Nocardia terpenica TaxID=455432 RepID=A0A164PIU4_9NOCA|nr:DUF4254 domain-containing protein [Nocardia terpenica]KZM75628.1 hypothetical protein AWN90_19905 [Nocardia terpenica]MBF6064772.1 DUF4254 domain-containing protein [Nocardia terpenica]MBF6107287.1 DUF4254 domain-containing protein [Nocardia terpenica]MBF6115044.1 DUF4254 domain-containing protein [Nocardia terpenica]MBF6122150.1 DUF4254 domain-containing protein [Nocardia terpenica]